jgi:hypothetical protein
LVASNSTLVPLGFQVIAVESVISSVGAVELMADEVTMLFEVVGAPTE